MLSIPVLFVAWTNFSVFNLSSLGACSEIFFVGNFGVEVVCLFV